MIVAISETTMAATAMRRVFFRSMTSLFIMFLSITASSVAYLSYAENMGHFLPLSFPEIFSLISAVFSAVGFSIIQLPRKHLYVVAYSELSCTSLRKLSMLRNSPPMGLISFIAYNVCLKMQKKWQLRHPALSRIGCFLPLLAGRAGFLANRFKEVCHV